jgi:hypothetical protein
MNVCLGLLTLGGHPDFRRIRFARLDQLCQLLQYGCGDRAQILLFGGLANVVHYSQKDSHQKLAKKGGGIKSCFVDCFDFYLVIPRSTSTNKYMGNWSKGATDEENCIVANL